MNFMGFSDLTLWTLYVVKFLYPYIYSRFHFPDLMWILVFIGTFFGFFKHFFKEFKIYLLHVSTCHLLY